MVTIKPSPARSITDALVLRALMSERRLTRAELADRVEISKPTASESVRRLTAEGLLHDSGARTTGRGRVGTYYEIPDDVGSALVVQIAPTGVSAEIVNLYGDVTAHTNYPLPRPARPRQVSEVLTTVAVTAIRAATAPVRLIRVSAAEPVDRATGQLVHLPDAPFLVGALDPVSILRPLIDAPIQVDNDVNWAARAEGQAHPRSRRSTDAGHPGDGRTASHNFAYLYLGEGLGSAIVSDATVLRGHAGLAGEPSHVLVTGPDGRAMPFTDVFAALGLRHPNSTAIDVERTIALINDPDGGQATRRDLARAIAGLIAAFVAMVDPAYVVMGGPWGDLPPLLDSIRQEVNQLPRPVEIRPARVTDQAPLQGAREDAVRALQDVITQLPGSPKEPPPGPR